MVSRRQFIRSAVGLAMAGEAAAGLYTWLWEPEWLEVVERDLPIRGLPPSLDGSVLAHLSDLHIGPRVDSEYIARTFATVQAHQPDFVMMTGDWITYRGQAALAELARLLDHFPRGRLATVGVLGNHDYGFDWAIPEIGDTVTHRAEAAGIRILRNESVAVEGLQFVGIDDFWGPKFGPPPSLMAPGAEPARLVLCHNPDVADEPIWAGYRGWILAGHTHGGQCKSPFLPPPILPVRNKRYSAGEIDLADGRRMYISRGVGYMIRVRFNVRPEVTLFRLRAAERVAT